MTNQLLPPSFQPKTVGLLGLGREGYSSYRFLRQQFLQLEIWGCDDQPLAQLPPSWKKALTDDPHLKIITTQAWLDQPLSAQVVIKTPGLPLTHPLVTDRRLQSVIWTTNTQLFFECLPQWSAQLHRPIVTIGVTGTKGKSTTTTAIFHLLNQATGRAVLGGNIGQPALNLLSLPTPDRAALPAECDPELYVVLELSAHQLAQLPYSPNWAVIQNIVPEHLDYYPDFASYAQAKSQIVRYQTKSDHVIYNPAYPQATKLAKLSPGHHHLMGIGPNRQWSARVAAGQFWMGNQSLCSVSEIKLKGEHNWENLLPTIVIGQALELTADQIKAALTTFTGLPHRLELVASHHQIDFYNDSLSTVPEATMAALSAFSDRPLALLAGGYERNQDFTQLANLILDLKIKHLSLFSPTGDRLWQNIVTAAQHRSLKTSALPSHTMATNMASAVEAATAALPDGGVVLLSPASPSFGLFHDYADRGDQFKQAALQLTTQSPK